jgi:putative oxidoreductase
MLFGLFTRPVGLVLAIWCVATALIAHSNIAERAQEIQFFKNMGLTGGFLYVAAFGGAWSLDAWRSRRRDAPVLPSLESARRPEPREVRHNR